MKRILLTLMAMIVFSACSAGVMPEATVDIDATVEAKLTKAVEEELAKILPTPETQPRQTPVPTLLPSSTVDVPKIKAKKISKETIELKPTNTITSSPTPLAKSGEGLSGSLKMEEKKVVVVINTPTPTPAPTPAPVAPKPTATPDPIITYDFKDITKTRTIEVNGSEYIIIDITNPLDVHLPSISVNISTKDKDGFLVGERSIRSTCIPPNKTFSNFINKKDLIEKKGYDPPFKYDISFEEIPTDSFCYNFETGKGISRIPLEDYEKLGVIELKPNGFVDCKVKKTGSGHHLCDQINGYIQTDESFIRSTRKSENPIYIYMEVSNHQGRIYKSTILSNDGLGISSPTLRNGAQKEDFQFTFGFLFGESSLYSGKGDYLKYKLFLGQWSVNKEIHPKVKFVSSKDFYSFEDLGVSDTTLFGTSTLNPTPNSTPEFKSLAPNPQFVWGKYGNEYYSEFPLIWNYLDRMYHPSNTILYASKNINDKIHAEFIFSDQPNFDNSLWIDFYHHPITDKLIINWGDGSSTEYNLNNCIGKPHISPDIDRTNWGAMYDNSEHSSSNGFKGGNWGRFYQGSTKSYLVTCPLKHTYVFEMSTDIKFMIIAELWSGSNMISKSELFSLSTLSNEPTLNESSPLPRDQKPPKIIEVPTPSGPPIFSNSYEKVKKSVSFQSALCLSDFPTKFILKSGSVNEPNSLKFDIKWLDKEKDKILDKESLNLQYNVEKTQSGQIIQEYWTPIYDNFDCSAISDVTKDLFGLASIEFNNQTFDIIEINAE